MQAAIKAMLTAATAAAPLQAITADNDARGVRAINTRTALGVDQWEVKWLRGMSIDARRQLATILNLVEATGTWPTQAITNCIVLMGEPTGGSRPIALMPMLYRIWTTPEASHPGMGQTE